VKCYFELTKFNILFFGHKKAPAHCRGLNNTSIWNEQNGSVGAGLLANHVYCSGEGRLAQRIRQQVGYYKLSHQIEVSAD
jgi:hypothetical protein